MRGRWAAGSCVLGSESGRGDLTLRALRVHSLEGARSLRAGRTRPAAASCTGPSRALRVDRPHRFRRLAFVQGARTRGPARKPGYPECQLTTTHGWARTISFKSPGDDPGRSGFTANCGPDLAFVCASRVARASRRGDAMIYTHVLSRAGRGVRGPRGLRRDYGVWRYGTTGHALAGRRAVVLG
jgi:hypothetical protein